MAHVHSYSTDIIRWSSCIAYAALHALLRPLPFGLPALAGAGLGCIHNLVQPALSACLLGRPPVKHLAIERPVGVGLYLAAALNIATRLALCSEPARAQLQVAFCSLARGLNDMPACSICYDVIT